MPIPHAHLIVSAALCALAIAAPLNASALTPEADPRQQREVPFYHNFSNAEVVGTALAGAGAMTMIIGGHDIFGAPQPSMGAPSSESVDWRFSHWANPNPDPDSKFLLGIPDYGAFAAPAMLLGFYATGWIGAEAKGGDFPIDNRKHEFMAYASALSWTLLVTNLLKFTVGRTRPFVVRPDLNRADYDYGEREWNLSFPSGHAAAAAVTSTFLALDVSDYLVRDVLADAGPGKRFMLGRVLPMLGATLITSTVMYSRVRDQKHWLSDTLTGALIGAGFATFFYTMHFDELGNPRVRQASRDGASALGISNAVMMPVGGPGQVGLSYGFAF